MARVLLVCGHRALARGHRAGGTEASQRWARTMLWQRLADRSRAPAVLLSGHATECPDAWAEQIAAELGIRWVAYAANGLRYASDGATRPWYSGDPVWRQSPRFPLLRNFLMVGAALVAADPAYAPSGRAHQVEVLGLLCRWSQTAGTEHTLSLAEQAGLTVTRLMCPDHFRGRLDAEPAPDEPAQPDREEVRQMARRALEHFRELRTQGARDLAMRTVELAAYAKRTEDPERARMRAVAGDRIARAREARSIAEALARGDSNAREREAALRGLEDLHAVRELELALRESEKRARCVASLPGACIESQPRQKRVSARARPAIDAASADGISPSVRPA